MPSHDREVIDAIVLSSASRASPQPRSGARQMRLDKLTLKVEPPARWCVHWMASADRR